MFFWGKKGFYGGKKPGFIGFVGLYGGFELKGTIKQHLWFLEFFLLTHSLSRMQWNK